MLIGYSSHAYLDEIRSAGIRAYRFEKGFLHTKTMLVDDNLSCVGSANMDNRSFRLNFEIILAVQDKDFAERMETMFLDDFSNSRELTGKALSSKPFLFRLASRVSRLLAPIQ